MSGDDDADTSIIKIGPVGKEKGDDWDEKLHTKIVQIFVSHDDEINSIQLQYVENGNLVLSAIHGACNGYNFDVVKLRFPIEYITSVSGYKSNNDSRLCSITFGTNLNAEHGPFGQFREGHDKGFKFKLGQDRQFAGFYGTANEDGVNSIGVYLKPNMTLDYSLSNNLVKLSMERESWEVLES
ncbi:hypothetical protein ACS0TY_022535 [Phlomoides rotata]